MSSMEETRSRSLKSLPPKILLALIWAALIMMIFLHRDAFSVEGVLHFTPGNPILATLVMLGLFALKSVSFVIYSGILYAASGILFPLPAAVLVNLLGTLIMASIPYGLGRWEGANAVERIRSEYPKAEALQKFRAQNDFLFSFLVRVIRVIPADIVSIYMGAAEVDYPKYLLGSVLAILPHLFTYPIMGMKIQDLRSPEFLISLGVEAAYLMITVAIYSFYKKQHEVPEEEDH